MRTWTKQVPVGLRDYLERLSYEVDARKDLLAFLLERGQEESDSFRRYHREYVDLRAQYELAKKELADRFVAPEHPEGVWRLDFATATLTIEEPA